MHYIFSIFSFLFPFSFFLFLFLFAILTLFNFLSSSIIFFLVQYFIPSNNFIFFLFSFVFLQILKNFPLYLLKFNSFTSFNLSSTSTISLPSLFSYKFLLTSFTPLSPIFSKLSTTKRSILSLFLQILFLFWLIFFLLFQPLFFSY